METQQLTERILSETWGTDVKLAEGKGLGGSDRSHVIRYHIDGGGPADIQTVVVKQAALHDGQVLDRTSTSGPAWRLFNDWAGLEFLSECFADVDDIPVPRFLAGDPDHGLIVMTDLGEGKGLDPLLLTGTAVDAEECLTALFQTVGRVHAVTCGKQARYNEIRDALGPRKSDLLSGHIDWHREHPPKGLAYLGVDIGDNFFAELEEAITEFRGDGPFRVYCHHDPCPDNILWIDKRVYLLDFEFSSMGNAAIDMRYPRAIWPTCWCSARTPAEVVERVETVYRAELVKGCPEAADDVRFYRQLTAGCADAALSTLGGEWLSWIVEKNARLGDYRACQQTLARLDAFVDISGRHGHFGEVADAIRAAAVSMRSKMPAEFVELPYYPAFR